MIVRFKIIACSNPIYVPVNLVDFSYAADYQKSDETDFFIGKRARHIYARLLPELWQEYGKASLNYLSTLIRRLGRRPALERKIPYYVMNHIKVFEISLFAYILLKNRQHVSDNELAGWVNRLLEVTREHREPLCVSRAKGMALKYLWDGYTLSRPVLKELIEQRHSVAERGERHLLGELLDYIKATS